ncbi:MmgE/PrpD family protein [Paraburkholderia diazotrophica]|uniref:MmgE/PrpD family protein n=1 Tax=Paraburkholderia diazotrophica TaxID=667676 RepID=UPI00317A49D1
MSTLTAVQRIGRFADEARFSDLTPQARQVFRRNILDSLGCAIAALPGPPFRVLIEQFDEYFPRMSKARRTTKIWLAASNSRCRRQENHRAFYRMSYHAGLDARASEQRISGK